MRPFWLFRRSPAARFDTALLRPPNGSTMPLQVNVVPEPGTLVLLVTAGLGLLACAWRRRQN